MITRTQRIYHITHKGEQEDRNEICLLLGFVAHWLEKGCPEIDFNFSSDKTDLITVTVTHEIETTE